MADPDSTAGERELGDLPGLEGRSTRELLGQWTAKDWAAWFREEVMPTESWEELASHFDPEWGFGNETDLHLDPDEDFARDPRTGEVDEGLRLGAVRIAREARALPIGELHAPASSLAGHPSESYDFFFSRLSLETKIAFFEGWYRVREDVPASPSETASKYLDLSGTDVDEGESIIPELQGLPVLDGPVPQSSGESSSPKISPMLIAIGGGVVLTLVLVWVFVLGGGDDLTDAALEPPAGASERQEIEFQTTHGTATYFGPTTFAAGAAIEVTIEVRDGNGEPVAGVPWYITVGDPPGSADAVHAEATTDHQGRAVFTLSAPGDAGPNKIWSSDGNEVWEVTEVEIT